MERRNAGNSESGTLFPELPTQKAERREAVPENSDGEGARPGPYRMRISRLTVDKLGIKLYDRVSAVLAEIIANAYDADATKVTVHIPFGVLLGGQRGRTGDPYEIVVEDDGHGMSAEDVNNHYLFVGSDRRTRFAKAESVRRNRRVMGRKGIGKLAPFGICNVVEVVTAGGERTERGYRVSHLRLRLDQIQSDSDQDYFPEVGEKDGTFQETEGTTIRLTNFNRKRVPKREDLHRQLCARFGLRRDDWDVEVVNTAVEGALPGMERDSFHLGELRIDLQEDTRITFSDTEIGRDGDGKPLTVTGWMAFAKDPYKDEVMAGVRIYTRGKIAALTRDFGATAGYTGEWSVRSYLTGELHVEWLDEEDDLVRSDRQDIIWSSDLGEVLREWGSGQVKRLARQGRSSVRRRTQEVFEEAARLDDRLMEEAPADPQYRHAVRDAFRTLVADSDREAANDPQRVERYVELSKNVGQHRELLEALQQVSKEVESPLDVVLALFQKARVAEFYALGQVAQERVDVINRLRDLIRNGTTPERPLQELIERAPWLLAPEWTPLGMNDTLDRVRDAFESWYANTMNQMITTSAIGDPSLRPDFVLVNGPRRTLWVVEIKRIGYHLTDAEYERAVDYLQILQEFLDAHPMYGQQFPIRRLTFIVDHVDKLSRRNRKQLADDADIEQRGWYDLLEQTDQAHRDFLAKVDKVRSGG